MACRMFEVLFHMHVPSVWRLAVVAPARPHWKDGWSAGWNGAGVHVASALHHVSNWTLCFERYVESHGGPAMFDSGRKLQFDVDGMTLFVSIISLTVDVCTLTQSLHYCCRCFLFLSSACP